MGVIVKHNYTNYGTAQSFLIHDLTSVVDQTYFVQSDLFQGEQNQFLLDKFVVKSSSTSFIGCGTSIDRS